MRSFFINQSKYLKWYYNTDYEGYPVHFHHANFFEFIIPLTGSYQVSVEEKIYDLQERDILIIPPGKLHGMLPTKESGGRVIFMVNMDFMYLYENYSDIMSFHTPTLYIRESGGPPHQEIYKLVMKMRNEYYHDNPFKDTYIYSLVLQIFVILTRSSLYETNYVIKKKNTQKKETFLMVQEYMKLHLQEGLGLDEIAKRFGFSKYYFSRLFKENLQMNFNQYLRALRMEQAERLLMQNTCISVQEIGYRCGYKSYGAFVKAFKESYGCAPTEYKRKNNDGKKGEREL